MPTHTDALLGQVVGGYRLSGVLGTGGMSIVFRGQRSDDPAGHVAIKVLLPPPATSPAAQATFAVRSVREVQMASRLRHEHIVPILSCGEVDGCPYLVMPILAGGSLAALLASKEDFLPLEEVARYGRQLADALDYAHERGIVHRDVKPQNILLDLQGKAYLTDFGIAHLFPTEMGTNEQGSGDEYAGLTTAGALLGTPRYMAPEQIQGERVVPATDIYALGVVLYQLVTGRVPFSAESPFVVALRQVRDTPMAPHLLRSALPAPASAAIMRALAKRPEDRFSSARALARAFAAGLEGRWSEGLSPQATWLDQDTTLAGAQDETLRDFPPLAMLASVPTREGVALPPRWPVAPALDSPRSRGSKPIWRRLSLGVALAALGCLILVAVAWGGSALVAALTSASSHATATATATSTPSLPSISVQGDAVYAMRAGDNSTLWSYSTDGNVLPSPPVVDGVVYPITTDGHLYALQITDGSVIWKTQVTGSSPSGSPAVADGVVYVAMQDGHVYALQTSDGTQIWRRRVRVDSRVTGSPTVTNDTVSIQTERGTVYTLRASDGTPLTGPTPTPTSGDNG